MTRQVITDGSGSWFDDATAIKFDEDTRWDGNNHISLATGSQWDHQWLCFTKSEKWVLHGDSQYQGGGESYAIIDDDEAVNWLIQNGYAGRYRAAELEKLPANIRDQVNAGIASLEV